MSTSVRTEPSTDASPSRPSGEHVVLVDGRGRPVGTMPKVEVHTAVTPLHLAFSCYLVRPGGEVLLTRRSGSKPTWPGVWTNACCGHPQLGETLRASVTRRVADELGLGTSQLGLVVPDFVYRAEMDGGPVEHELCPVLAAAVEGDPCLDPDEVADASWVSWHELVERAMSSPGTISPWSVRQVRRLDELGWTPERWLAGERFGVAQAPLDVPNDAAPAVRRAGTATGALDVVEAAVTPILEDRLAVKGGAVTAIDGLLGEVVEQVAVLVRAGGKRLRPAFVYWGHRATGADHDDGSLHVAAAMELLHTFALLHDDVMDRSATRRSRPTANRALADRHRADGRAGDSEWFGTSAAILAGDLTFVWADEVLHDAPLGAGAIDRCRRAFDELRTEVLAGQFLDLVRAGDRRTVEADAAKVALLKSARYTVTRPLLLGVALADPAVVPAALPDRLGTYGDAVGMAFQLRDDVLGLFGDPATMGKSDLDDLHEGKMTMLVVRARQLATPAQLAVLDEGVGDPDLDDAGAARVREVVAATGALASIERLLAAKHMTAIEAIADLPEPARSSLVDLADLAIVRRA